MSDTPVNLSLLSGQVATKRVESGHLGALVGQVMISALERDTAGAPANLSLLVGQVAVRPIVPLFVSRLRGSVLVSEAERVIVDATGNNLKRQQY